MKTTLRKTAFIPSLLVCLHILGFSGIWELTWDMPYWYHRSVISVEEFCLQSDEKKLFQYFHKNLCFQDPFHTCRIYRTDIRYVSLATDSWINPNQFMFARFNSQFEFFENVNPLRTGFWKWILDFHFITLERFETCLGKNERILFVWLVFDDLKKKQIWIRFKNWLAKQTYQVHPIYRTGMKRL